MSENKYDVILDELAEAESRPEVLFRQAGDGFLQIEYGANPRFNLVDSFRTLTINEAVKGKKVKGLFETVPGIRTNLFHFDPEILSAEDLIAQIKEAEEKLAHVEDIVFESRIISLPIAFEDSETKKAVAKYLKEVRPEAPNAINGYNIEYMAPVQRSFGCRNQADGLRHRMVQQWKRLLAGWRIFLAP